MMAADVIGSLAWGESFHMVRNETVSSLEIGTLVSSSIDWIQKPQLIEDIEGAMIVAGLRLELPIVYYLLTLIPLPAVRTLTTLHARVTAAGMRAVQNTKEASKGVAKTIFSNMYPEDGKQPFSDSLMANEAGNLIVAGSDSELNLSLAGSAAILIPLARERTETC